MSQAAAHPQLPRFILRSAAAMVVAVVVLVAFVRLTGIGVVKVPEPPVVEQRDLRFLDRSDGSIDVVDPSNDALVRKIEPGSNGFLRGTMRGLARERRRSGIGDDVPFRLVAHADGRMTLADPATGRKVDLGSFGPTNAAVFAELMLRDTR
ncbi:MAG: putative photosynthetic complex assembly protein PuhC [Burkholderiaceae bacterium]|jgi:putative photosynthetic complex assembly protein|nr:putative photosynthetic complex assembly protein PuhC [Burkholderiaceae bacterium]